MKILVAGRKTDKLELKNEHSIHPDAVMLIQRKGQMKKSLRKIQT
jgi:hypothetical protein